MPEEAQPEVQLEAKCNSKKCMVARVIISIVIIVLIALTAYAFVKYSQTSSEIEDLRVELDEAVEEIDELSAQDKMDDETMIGYGAAPSNEGMSDPIQFRGYSFRIPEDWTYETVDSGSGDAIDAQYRVQYYDEEGQDAMTLYCPPPETGFEAWETVRLDTREIVSNLTSETNAGFVMGEPMTEDLGYWYHIYIQTTQETEDDTYVAPECSFITTEGEKADEEIFYNIFKSILLHL